MNLVRFSYILLLTSILNDNCISAQAKIVYGGIIARDCNMVRPPDQLCKPKEVIPILARQYYRLYYFKMICNAINLGDNVIAVPTLCFETGVPAPGEFVAVGVGASHNWCYNAPEHVARDFISIIRNDVSITFVRLIPPIPGPCHPVEISDPASEPRIMKGFNWNSRKTFGKSDSYDRCISSVPSALLYSRPNEFWGFQHPNCEDPIPIKGYIDELHGLLSNDTLFVEANTTQQEPEPITPAPNFSGNDAAGLEKPENEIDKLNHTIEDLKAKIEDDEQKIYDLENNVDQDRKHIKDSLEELREQEQTNQQWIEDLEKTMINDEGKLKELEEAIKQPNQVTKPIEDLKKQVEDDEDRIAELMQAMLDEDDKMDELQNVVDELQALLLEDDEKNIENIGEVVNATDQNNPEPGNTIEELKEQLNADEKKIDELENIVETTQKHSSKIINTIEDLMGKVEIKDKDIVNDDEQRKLIKHLESTLDEILKRINEIEKQDDVTNKIINDLQEKVKNLTLQDQIKGEKIRDLESKIYHTLDNIDKLDSNNFAKLSTNTPNQLKDNSNCCETLTHQINILTNNECFTECENFVQTSKYIESVQNFIENVNGTLKNNADEMEQFKEFMKDSQFEIAHIEKIVHELVDKFFDNMNSWSKFKIEIDEKVDNVVRTNEQLQESVMKTDDTLKHLSKYINY